MTPPGGINQATEGEIRLGSGTALTLASQMFALGANVVIGVLIARTLGAAGKGVLSVVQQTVGIALVVANLGVSTSNIYYLSRREVSPGVATGNLLALGAVVTVAVGVPMLLLLSGPLAVLPVIRPHLALIAIASFATGLVLAWFGSVVVGLRGLRPQAVTGVVTSATTLVLVFVLTRVTSLSVAGVVLAGVFGTLAGIVTMAWWARGRIGRISVDTTVMRATARHSLKVHMSGLADYLHLRQDILLLGWLAGASAVGLYSVGVSFAELAWYIPNAVGLAIQAQGARVSHESALDFAARGLRVSVLITAVVAAGLSLVVPWVLPALFGEAFRSSIDIFYLLLPGAALNGLATVMLYYQISRGLVYWRVSLAAMVANIAGNVVLVPLLGAPGAAVASSLSYVLYFVWVLALVSRDTGTRPYRLLVPTIADVRILSRTLTEYIGQMSGRPRSSTRS